MELGVYSCTPPASAQPHACTGCNAQPAAARRVAADKENVLPCGTPQGSPQLPILLGADDASGGTKGGKAAGEQPARRPLSDVTQHYAAASKGICIGALGGGFGMDLGGPLAASCSQEAQAAAAAANKARVAAVRRQALRAMR
ncbi:bromodomain adjacent to zinc finger domain 1A [Chlorella sorokiniana]|uniref:Bromodomain adjacent to zinc finger domain 1A n=1 Tax=Chlorella sorokiniana TaxID=3076 RepID=A0A2P6TS68_CHLSO|nr:bromodomain adjacent to zinc finger domain 1A [Chlorella sorokiniana]|eukprot:PRW56907.1 bromodomain adjacent to zinc finger domain 1A [Chlorella sorokiniana]